MRVSMYGYWNSMISSSKKDHSIRKEHITRLFRNSFITACLFFLPSGDPPFPVFEIPRIFKKIKIIMRFILITVSLLLLSECTQYTGANRPQINYYRRRY